jgi:RNA polymerase sigma-70 factor (ECF subfamily)
MKARPEFEALVEAHSAEIFAYLWRMLRQTADAEDCLQETFLRAYRAYPRLNGQANYRAWLYKIATNTARTHLKRRARSTERTTDLDPELLRADSHLSDELDRKQTLALIAQAIEALPHQQRAALIMRNYQELSYPAIAAALDCTEDAARANVYQALKKLRAKMTEDR